MAQSHVKPGNAARFAIVDARDGRRSLTWTVATAKNSLDVYVMARCMGHLWKVSLHETGEWHLGFTEAGAEKFIPDAPSRHFHMWDQPADFAPGFHRSIQIVVPDSELRAWPSGVVESKSWKIIAIPPPGAGNVAVIEVLFAPLGDWEPVELNIDEAFRVATLERFDGSTVSVVAIRQPWAEEDRPRVERQKADAMAGIPAAWWGQVAAPRCVALGIQEDGVRYVLDLAADAPVGVQPVGVADDGGTT